MTVITFHDLKFLAWRVRIGQQSKTGMRILPILGKAMSDKDYMWKKVTYSDFVSKAVIDVPPLTIYECFHKQSFMQYFVDISPESFYTIGTFVWRCVCFVILG